MKNKIIKVLHVLQAVGGVDVSLRVIINNIDETKFENIIVHGKDDTKNQYFTKNNQKVKEYKLSIIRNISIFKDINAIFKVREIIKKENIRIIHAHSAKGGLIARFASLFKGITVLHTPQAYSYLSVSNPFRKSVYLSVEKLLKHFNSKLLASSKSELNRGLNEVNYKKNKTILFNNCIKPITKLETLDIPKTWPDNYICTVGRPSYQKRLDMMIKVVSLLKKDFPNIHLVIMGVGFYAPDLEIIKGLIKDLDLEKNISLLEWTSHQNIYNIVSKSKLYISTARYEGLPYSIIEALALKKPIVATNVDGNRDLIEEGKNGYLIDNEDTELMTKKIKTLLEDEKMLEKFSKASENLFYKNYNVDNNIKKLEEIYINNLK